MKALWYPGAIRDPGPAHKPDGDRPYDHGLIFHSTVGTSYSGARNVLMGSGVTNWHGTIDYNGDFYQHYPMNLHCDHSGNHPMNDRLVGIEVVGGPVGHVSEPWRPAQVARGAHVLGWLLDEGWIPNLARTGDRKSCYRHREVSSTACDSFRCPWNPIIRIVKARTAPPVEDEDMADPQARAAIELLIESAHLQQSEIDMLKGQSKFLQAVATNHQERILVLEKSPAGPVDPQFAQDLDAVTKATEQLEKDVAVIEDKLEDAAAALV